MLVNRQQDWIAYEESVPSVPVKTAPAPAVSHRLRRQCFILAAVMALMAMILTFQCELIVRSGYSLVQLKNQAAGLEKDNEKLRLDIARLKSPQRIHEIAQNNLGMVTPQTMLYATNTVAPGSQPKGTVQVAAVVRPGATQAGKGR